MESSSRDFCSSNKIARDAGMNLLIIDERAMQRSEGRAVTLGIKERRDVKSWCEYLRSRFGDVPIFIMGVSMGAPTVQIASELELSSNVNGVIADCPYSSPIGIFHESRCRAEDASLADEAACASICKNLR